jgi:hypothetical protein
MRGRFAVTSVGVALAGMLVLVAQQHATLTLGSGAVITGELIDLGAGGFTVRVNGENREIRRDEVRMIDFGGDAAGTPSEATSLTAGASVAQLRSGEAVVGEFYDISGTSPLRITFRTANGERVLQSSDVRRIYVTRAEQTAAAPPTPGPTPTPIEGGKTVTVSARTAWTATGVNVARGQTVRFSATGEIQFSPQNHKATPAGSVDNLFDSRAPVRSALQGALVGRVTAARTGGAAFLIGDRGSVVMPADGQLFLGVNDSGLGDNQGSFTVTFKAE